MDQQYCRRCACHQGRQSSCHLEPNHELSSRQRQDGALDQHTLSDEQCSYVPLNLWQVCLLGLHPDYLINDNE